MKRRSFKNRGIGLSFFLSASAFLILQLSGAWRVAATTSNQPTNEGPVSSRIIAEHPPVELVEKRDDHTRIWEIAREVETTHPDGSATVDTVKSYIHEKASGLCYKDATGNYVPSVAEWRETPEGFVIDRCPYRLAMGKTIGTAARYTVEGHDLLLRPAHLIVSDGVNVVDLATLNPETPGFISLDKPSVLRFPSAFGEGYDLEYVAEKGGFHQNLIITERPALPDGVQAEKAAIYLYTEMNLDQYVAASGCDVLVEGETVSTADVALTTPPSRGGSISFCRGAEGTKNAGDVVHGFYISRVADSSAPGGPPNETVAEKRLLKDSSTGAAYLVESLPASYLLQQATSYPVTWDYEQRSGSIGDETWEPRFTYWVSSDIYVSDATLTILPGTTVKLNPDTGINVGTDGEIIARGEPYNYITFTKARDDNCGERIFGPADEPYFTAIDLAADSSPDSIIQYCKMGHGLSGVYCRQSLHAPIAHNVIHGGNEMYWGIIVLCLAETECSNNLVTGSNWCGIFYTDAAPPQITNNTVDSSSCGIQLSYTSCDYVNYNLLTMCATGISVYGSTVTLDYNGYWRCTTPVSGGNVGPNSVELGYDDDPYESSPLGDFYLNDTAGAGHELKHKDWDITEFGALSGYLYTTEKPQTAPTSISSGSETWGMVDYEDDPDYVDIGYHHNRVDWYMPSTCTVTGSGTSLTIDNGVVVAMSGTPTFMYLYVDSGAKLTCVGDPLDEGYNVITNSKLSSALIESPVISMSNPLFVVGSNASAETAVEYTKMTWLGAGFWPQGAVPSEVRNNIFFLNYYGLYEGSTCDRYLCNDLFYCNEYGGSVSSGDRTVTNCTFDANSKGLYASVPIGSSLIVTDSLFTENDYGIYLSATTGDIEEAYNAFWENGVAIQGADLGVGSQVLSDSPYYAPAGSAWQARYRVNQDSPAVDAGSCLAVDRWPQDHNRYTTRADGVCDLGMVDIAFHFYDFEDADGDGMDDNWEQEFGLDPESNDAAGDKDGDGLTNLEEYQGGLNPASKDTDGDGRNDPEGGQYDPLIPNYDKGPYLQNTHYVTGQGSAITVMCETPSNGKKPPNVRYRVPPDDWNVKQRTAYRLIESPHYAHEIELTGLQANATYEYEVGYDSCYVRGDPDPWTFFTAPSAQIPFRFVVYGDNRGDTGQPWGLYQLQENHQAVVNAILTYSNPGENPIRFVLHSGDLLENGGDYAQWNPQFFDPAKPLLSNIAGFECLGNHEWKTHQGDPGEAKYLAFFIVPEGYVPPDPQHKTENWYSFDYANCHFIVLDTELDAPDDYIEPNTAQHNWLLTDISSTEATGAAWVIVLLHIPPYTDAAPGEGHHYGSGDVYRVRTHLAPVFEDPAHPADLVFSGHNHFYERSQSTDDEQPGYYVHYIVTGGGGAPTHTPGYDNPERVDYPPYPGKAEETLHHCVIDINGTTATLNVVRNNGTYVEQNVILTPGQQWP